MNKLSNIYTHIFIGGHKSNILQKIYINKSSKLISGYVTFGNNFIFNFKPNIDYEIEIYMMSHISSYLPTLLINNMIHFQDSRSRTFTVYLNTYTENINDLYSNIVKIENKNYAHMVDFSIN